MMLRGSFLLAAFFCFFHSPGFAKGTAKANDPYNALLWNRSNYEAKNGSVDQGDWYEWWYYKVIDPETHEAFFLTYGVINPWDNSNSLGGTKAVVQLGNFKDHILIENDYPVSQFQSRYDKTSIEIAGNVATDKILQGHAVESDGQLASWNLSIRRDWTFDAMGWGMRVPDISGIYWYPAQASAAMTGWIQLRGKTYQFKDAPAYQDRNWGRSFPKWWTWLHSNHFKNSPGTTLSAGGGTPKVLDSFYVFAGICIGLKHQGLEYIFRTTDADTVKFDIHWGVWKIWANNFKGQKIEISAYAPPGQFMLLPFQSPRGPVFNDYEALLGHMTVKLYEWSYRQFDWIEVAALETEEAGIEWGSPDPVDLLKLFNSDQNLQ